MEEYPDESFIMSLIKGFLKEKGITKEQISNRLLRRNIYVPFDMLEVIMESMRNDG